MLILGVFLVLTPFSADWRLYFALGLVIIKEDFPESQTLTPHKLKTTELPALKVSNAETKHAQHSEFSHQNTRQR